MAGTNKLLIRGGQVYDHDGDVHHPPVADILIENDRIAAVGTHLATEDNIEIINASRRLVVPG
jgi:5-methylthioadenosine/S-adenosylhomocysteine deaminase